MIRQIRNIRSIKTSFCQEKGTRSGFTLAELMIAAVVLILTLAGILLSYLRCIELAELSKNSSLSVHSSRSRFETIRNTDFDQIKPTFNNVTFTTTGLTGIGVTYIDDTNPRLLKITVTYCWRQSNGRILGEDSDLDGVLDAGEDKNANAVLDSPTTFVSYIFEG